MAKNIQIRTIEKMFINAFGDTVIDYGNNKIEVEEDCRAAMYYHLRPMIDSTESLEVFLSHNLNFVDATMKPDITIVRSNKYLLCAELKIATNVNRSTTEVNGISAREDIPRFEYFRKGTMVGYTLRIEKKERNIIATTEVQEWMCGYYKDLYYVLDGSYFSFWSFYVELVGKKRTIKAGQVKVKIKELLNSGESLFDLIEIGFIKKHKVSPF